MGMYIVLGFDLETDKPWVFCYDFTQKNISSFIVEPLDVIDNFSIFFETTENVFQLLLEPGTKVRIVLQSGELYDPATNTWSSVADMSLPRSRPTPTVFPDGRVFVVGRHLSLEPELVLGSTALHDPVTNIWAGQTSENQACQQTRVFRNHTTLF